MLDHREYMPLDYIKKQPWTGSFQGMRFLLHKKTEPLPEEAGGEPGGEQTRLEAVVWKEPFAYEQTPEEEKTRQCFELNEDGREQAIAWLEAEYEAHKELWKRAMQWDWKKENS